MIGIVSGYWNPLHFGHLNLLQAAKRFVGDGKLIVIINNAEQIKLKGSKPFMTETERLKIISAIKYVDLAILSIDTDKTVVQTLGALKEMMPHEEFYFLNGGDVTKDNCRELPYCEDVGIQCYFNIGGIKVQSSSSLLKNVK